MVYAEISIDFEAITPVSVAMVKYDEELGDYSNKEDVWHLSPGEQGNSVWNNYEDSNNKYFQEVQAFNMDKNLPLIPQIVAAIYGSDNLPYDLSGFYIKSGLIKVKIVGMNGDYATQNQGGNKEVMEMFSSSSLGSKDLDGDIVQKITALGDVMEFQSQLNSAIKQYYELNHTNFIINYNQTLPRINYG